MSQPYKFRDVDSLKWDVIKRAASVEEAWRRANAFQRQKVVGNRMRRLASALSKLHEAVNP